MFMETQNHESKIDVRIIVGGLDIAQLVSKAVNNIQLENDYNIIVSSIIPTVELSIVKKVASGADILLIGGYGHDETYNILYNELKTDFNHIGLFDYNNIIIEDESIDFKLAEKEILNSIIKSTLSYSLNLINIHTLENKLMKVTHNYNNLLDDYNQLIKEQEVLTHENSELREDIDDIKSDYSAFKSRYEDIYSKEILEIFSYIAAESRNKAVEWLNIVRTALIFVDDNEDDLKRELNSDDETKAPEVIDDYEIPNNFENFWD